MPKLATLIGLLLVATGLVGYFGSGMESLTALIPAIFGALMAALGGLAWWRPATRKHAMHAALVIALLGFLGSTRGIPDFFTLLAGGEVDRPWAAVVQFVMLLLTAAFVAAGMRSFVMARRARVRSEG